MQSRTRVNAASFLPRHRMLLAIALLTTMHVTAPADSITGKWLIKGDVAGTPFNTTCDIRQTGTTLSGLCTPDKGPPMPVTGQLKDATFSFQHGGDYQGQELTIIYAGALESPRQLKGTITVKPFEASGTFTAEPAPK